MSNKNQSNLHTSYIVGSRGIYCHKTLFFSLIILLSSSVLFSQTTFTVTSTGDGVDSQWSDGICNNGFGECTFRAAIEQANYTNGIDTILFNIAGEGPHTIQPNYAFPEITESIVIDGTSEPEFTGTPVVELDGTNISEADGLIINAGNSVVQGLAINRFESANGITLRQNGGNIIEGCYVGTDPTGTIALGNIVGIHIDESQNNVIGGISPASRNIVSGNNENGVLISGSNSTNNHVIGNYIGTDPTGTIAIGNGIGVYIDESQNNIIGGTEEGSRNIISGNIGSGIDISAITDADLNNQIIGNFIGTDVTGTLALGNDVGIFLFTGGNVVGGAETGAGNLISGNNSDGLAIAGMYADANQVMGNYIGTDVDGTSAVPNVGSGIYIESSDNTIGGAETGAGNLISGNNSDGILIAGEGPSASNNIVQGNFIGTDITGSAALGNGISGITVTTTNNLIGGTTASARNVICGNDYIGIRITGEWNDLYTADSNIVQGNYIGLDATGNIIIPNGTRGMWVWDGSDNLIGGLTPGAGNTIVGHGVDDFSAIYVVGAGSRNNRILSNSTYGNALGIDLATVVSDWNENINDPLDIDEGANRHQNYPEILQATIDEFGDFSIKYHVGSHHAYADYPLTIQFFKADNINPCQGETLLVTDIFTVYDYVLGYKMIELPDSNQEDLWLGDFITATATDSSGNTSEFNPGATISAAFDFNISDSYFIPGMDSVIITSRMSSSDGLVLNAIMQAPDSIMVASVQLYDDGAHFDGLSGDSVFGNFWVVPAAEERNHFIDLQVSIADTDSVSYDNIARFTTIGPVVIDSLMIFTPSSGHPLPGDRVRFKLQLRNIGNIAAAEMVRAIISLDDSLAFIDGATEKYFGEILADTTAINVGSFYIEINDDHPMATDIDVNVVITSNGYPYWFDTATIHVYDPLGVASSDIIPEKFSLHQNYPNPFNPVTTIQYELPHRSNVQLTIFDLLGRKVTTLVAETQEAGYRSVIWDATNDRGQPVSAGMYIYQVNSGTYTQTRKMVVLK